MSRVILNLRYLYRYALWNTPTIFDYRKFPSDPVDKGDAEFSFKHDRSLVDHASSLLNSITYNYKSEKITRSLDEFLKSTETTGFIVARGDEILMEKYFNGFARDSVFTSFSVAKSFLSSLVGIAVDEGKISSLYEKVIDYIPELRGKVSDELNIEHLLNMSSGLGYDHRYYPWSDEPKSYHFPDLQHLVLKNSRKGFKPGSYFMYTNYNAILLGLILLRTTNELPQKYLQDKIWTKIGMQYPASWSTDSRKSNFPKLESGINARCIDYAKFGLLILNSGRWDKRQIISPGWFSSLNTPPEIRDPQYYQAMNFFPYKMFFSDKRLYYKLGWWGLRTDGQLNDLVAIGNLGQFIYISPSTRIIIVRNGIKWGKINWWPALFTDISNKLNEFG